MQAVVPIVDQLLFSNSADCQSSGGGKFWAVAQLGGYQYIAGSFIVRYTSSPSSISCEVANALTGGCTCSVGFQPVMVHMEQSTSFRVFYQCLRFPPDI